MKNVFKKIVKKNIQKIFDIEYTTQSYNKQKNFYNQSFLSQIEQKKLFFYYKQLAFEKKLLPSIKDVGFKVFSQCDEDGILLYIFSLIGVTNKICLDIAYANPLGANTTNLIVNWDWNGILVCSSCKEKELVDNFFSTNLNTLLSPPLVVQKWVTAENINNILLQNDISGEIDLFSLDIDGVDYWIWNELEVIKPRVIVIEFQNVWWNKKAVTVPYKSNFKRNEQYKDFISASLPAFVKLANRKGYRLVGCNKYSFNAFFVKNGLAEDLLPTLSVEECLYLHPTSPWLKKHRNQRLSVIENLDWIEV